MTEAEKQQFVTIGRRRLAVVSFVWMFSILLMSVTSVMAQSSAVEDSDIARTLSSGSAQAVLSVVVLGLTGAVLFLLKRLLAVQDARVKETKELFEEKITANTEALQRVAQTGEHCIHAQRSGSAP